MVLHVMQLCDKCFIYLVQINTIQGIYEVVPRVVQGTLIGIEEAHEIFNLESKTK